MCRVVLAAYPNTGFLGPVRHKSRSRLAMTMRSYASAHVSSQMLNETFVNGESGCGWSGGEHLVMKSVVD